MADMDPELAFLNAQKEYDPAQDYSAAVDQPDADDDDDEYDPTTAFSTYPPQGVHSPSAHSGSMQESTANTPAAEADGALKPLPAEAASATPSKQPAMRGGFVVESEDEEDVPVANPQQDGSAAQMAAGRSSGTPQRSLSHTPITSLPAPNVPLHSTQDQAHSGISTFVTANDITHNLASIVPNGGTPVPDVAKAVAPDVVNLSARPSTAPITPVPASLPKARLPQDRIGILEDRVTDDPRGDIEAWLSLIEEHRRRHKFDEARAVYDRFFTTFPSAADQWIGYVNMESDLEEFARVERLFERSIMSNPHVALWSTYVNYIRRRNNLTTDQTGNARTIITQVYEFVLENVGIDVGSGRLWQEYIEFVKSGPGVAGGSTWQDMQKMDTMRKIYQRAIAVPTSIVMEIWQEYNRFELTLNKATGRKNLQEKSPYYMTARSANNVLENITKGVIRTTLPKMPPAQGFAGYNEYMEQVSLWKHWIQWEKDDPLVLKDDDKALLNKRIVYIYKQALMALRFWPELWYDAAEWCFQNNLDKEGNEFLTQGIDANPESCLLAFRKAYQVELAGDFEEGDAGVIRKGDAVREPFNKLLEALYELTNKTKKREDHSLARAKEDSAAQQAAEDAARANADTDSDDEEEEAEEAKRRLKERGDALQMQLQAISAGYNAQIILLKKTISYAWIALMRTMRRIQGKGRPDAPAGIAPGFRGIFAEARKKGKLLSDAYVANALIEHHCYQDPAATRIFDRGMKLFPDDEHFALEYIKFLVKQNDATNARAVFETVVNRLTQKPESVARSKPLFVFFHKYEAEFGELAQITKLEKRMNDLFPEDPKLLRFAERFSTPQFDPTSVRPIVSPQTQMMPIMLHPIVPTVEEPLPPPPQVQEPRISPPAVNSPRVVPALMPMTNSPKRPFDEVDTELAQPRKLMRGESPLKGAAGRRLDAARRNMVRASEGPASAVAAPAVQPFAREINFILSIIPGAQYYHETRFNPERMVALLQSVNIHGNNARPPPTQAPITPVAPPPMHWGPPPPATGMGGFYGR
ncbi:hypothetical protein P154DRAFT_516905 [Amniculicola lignicola CBS 123094]|uniref:mRNA 3'-end-processing protein RNA14 n=1 Tax=Amniculicola lignicola CBS 123094 TaxID=1392246 RepID=A0A6A5X5M6_9PLEO|nr:hypothetical protein P154DRAFT_516905 [Amniculicola lignicola CBS 123094]